MNFLSYVESSLLKRFLSADFFWVIENFLVGCVEIILFLKDQARALDFEQREYYHMCLMDDISFLLFIKIRGGWILNREIITLCV